ncbi:MAG: hypothetical protein WCC22_02235 [Terriglobales bacterium]
MTIAELQAQKRWVLWRLEHVNGKDTKVPYQPNGRKAMANNPATWRTYAECAAVVSQFSGVGMTLGDGVFGVDIDKCCDAVTGKFTPESREIVIGLDSYGEYSPSGTGCHVFGLGDLPGDGKCIVRPGADFKQIEIKGAGYYFTFTGRHLHKTPLDLLPRQEQLNALCARVLVTAPSKLTVPISGNEEERFRKLMAGDLSDYNGDHSRADLALCSILARRCHNDLFQIDDEFRKSGLYREKWERSDYRSATILKAAKGEPIFDAEEEIPIEDDGPTEYLVDALSEGHEGWFPKGEVSLIGGSSGSGKTYWMITLLGKVHKGGDVWGHKATARDYRVLLHDRSPKAMFRTMKALGLPSEARERIIRLSIAQQMRPPAEILEPLIDRNPGVEAWFIEGLDLWIPKQNEMAVVAPILDGLQRLATRRNVAVVASMGAPKQKPKDRYFGRDALFGSSAFARKVETVVTITLTDADNGDSVRRYTVFPRNGRVEDLYMGWSAGGLTLVDKPAEQVNENTARYRMGLNVLAAFKPGDQVVYSPDFGPEATFYRWRKRAVKDGQVVYHRGAYFVARASDTKPN